LIEIRHMKLGQLQVRQVQLGLATVGHLISSFRPSEAEQLYGVISSRLRQWKAARGPSIREGDRKPSLTPAG
jgi:hypothetical protein